MKRVPIKKRVELVLLSLLIVLFATSLAFALETYLNVPNPPPVLLNLIPNQTWGYNTNLTNAFNLYDYFYYAGDSMNFSYTLPSNISVVINTSVNGQAWVSFYPQPDFRGTNEITFTALGGPHSTESNLVFLNVGTDNEAPKWYFPSKNRIKIYTGSYVTFETLWVDNIQLKNYTFYLNQGAGFLAYAHSSFNGTVANSEQEAYIAAPAETFVQWMFCARDTNGNQNCTDSQNFTVSSLPILPMPEVGEVDYEGGVWEGLREDMSQTLGTRKRQERFKVEPNLFKVSLKQGQSTTRILRITNLGTIDININISVSALENFILLNTRRLVIPPQEYVDVTIDFQSRRNDIPEQYFGGIKVYSNTTRESFVIPVVLDINLFESDFEIKVNVLNESKEIASGDPVLANITVTSLKDVEQTSFVLYTALKDFYGTVYNSNEEPITVSSLLNLNRELVTNEDMANGPYIFYARIYNDNLTSIDSDSFQIGSVFSLASTMKTSFLFVLIAVLSIFALFLAVTYRKEMNKEKLLGLYLMVNELKRFIEEGKNEEALNLYIKMKLAYGENVSRDTIKNKDLLREEIKKLNEQLSSNLKESIPESTLPEQKKTNSLPKPDKEVALVEKTSEIDKETDKSKVKASS